VAKGKFQKDPDSVQLVSPKGQLLYPHILKPNEMVYSQKLKKMVETKKKDKMAYSVSLILDAEDDETKDLIETIKGLQDKAKNRLAEKLKEKYPKKKKFSDEDYDEVGGMKKLPFKVLKDEAGEPTGDIQFNFKRNGFYKDKETDEFKKIGLDVFDGKGNKLTNPKLMIGNGSIARIKFEASPYCSGIGAGVSLRLEAVKLLKLEEFKAGGNRSAEDYGFDMDEDAEFSVDDYDLAEDEEEEPKASKDSDESEAEDDDTDDGDDEDEEEDF
jgi:hypothetical protein